ncbi:transposase [Bacillus timonensis]|nr:transposase [Bacillus timonensis]
MCKGKEGIIIPRQARTKSRTKIYHIIWRGASRQEIFHDEEDCINFLNTIEKYQRKTKIRIYAWCLMNNHIHLLLREGNEPISDTMKRIGVSFVKYYNWKYRTTGHLFQDRFISENVESRSYLLTVVRYIHQNPVKAGMVEHPNEWKWSSSTSYLSERIHPPISLDREYVLHMFSKDLIIAKERFKAFNEKKNNDQCLDINKVRSRLTDDEARQTIKEIIGNIEIPHVKFLPRQQRNEILRKVKEIKGLSQRQAARIFGVSPNLVFKA